MNRLDFTNTGVLHLYQETLALMQDTYTPVLKAITKAIGDNVIIEGCVRSGSFVSNGTVIIGQEIMPFEGGNATDGFKVKVLQTVQKAQYNDGQLKDFAFIRKAGVSTDEGISFDQFVSLKTLSELRNLPVQSGSDYSKSLTDTLATIKAVYDLKQELKKAMPMGVILMWAGSVASIPTGWALCDGQSGRPNLRDRFVVGAGNEYQPGQTGGENYHTLSVLEMPSHDHDIETAGDNTLDNNSGGYIKAQQNNDPGTFQIKKTETTGIGLPHENRPPYYALAYIIKL